MTEPIHVLYVDGELTLLQIGKIFLERLGDFSVTIIPGAEEAIKLLKEELFDVIISDYQMPQMDGIAFLKYLKAEGNPTPFILFTGKGREEVVIEALNNGADFYLQKGGEPASQFAELSNKIRYTVSRRRAESELLESQKKLADTIDFLRESEERYRNIIEDQTEFISRFLPDGTHVFVNEAYCRYFGFKREEMLGHRFKPKLPAEDRIRLQEFLASFTPEYPYGSIEHRIIMPDGSIRWQRWSDRAIFDQSGKLIEYQSVGRDITETKEAINALLESERKYRTLFETTGTATVLLENDGTISLANSEFERLSGYSKEELETKKKWMEFVVREDLEQMLSQHRMRREAHEKALIHYEFRFRSRNGEIHNIYLTIDVIPGTLQSVASLLDITERDKAEQALRESEQKYRDIYENAVIGIFKISLDGRFLSANTQAARILGYESADELIQSITDINTQIFEDPADSIKAREIIRENGHLKDFEAKFRRKNGDIIWGMLNTRIVRDSSGNMLYHEAISQDITDRKQAEEALRQANRQLNLMTSITRHDINNKVSSILAYICLAKDDISNPELTDYCNRIQAATNMIKTQIEFTKIYQDIGTNEPRWENLDHILHQMPVPDTITLNTGIHGLEVYADPMLERVFFNLLDNSIRHGEKVTEIRVHYSKQDEGITIFWEDFLLLSDT